MLFRWSPDHVREGMNLSTSEALTALVSKYFDCVVAAEQSEVEEFFGNFVSRSRVRDAINALLSAREIQFAHLAGRTLLQITPERLPIPPRTGVRPERPERIERPPRPIMPVRKPGQGRPARSGGPRPRWRSRQNGPVARRSPEEDLRTCGGAGAESQPSRTRSTPRRQK